MERECCSRGLKRDKFLRSCSERVDVLREYRDHDESLITEECIAAFATCCEQKEGNPSTSSTSGTILNEAWRSRRAASLHVSVFGVRPLAMESVTGRTLSEES